jgi:chromate transporter
MPAGAVAHAHAPVPLSQTLGTLAVWLAVWIVPLAAVVVLFESDHVLAQIAWFFSKLAVVTFGGAYAVLAYMAQAVVESYGWLTPGEMLDGLAAA